MKVSELKQWPKVYQAFADNDELEDFLDSDDRERILYGFCWDFSTQGHEFWSALYEGNVEKAKELCPDLFETEGELQQDTGPAVDSEGFIKWEGGEMPVHEDVAVDVKFRDGGVEIGDSAGYWKWGHSGRNTNGDIVGYKLHIGDGYVDGVKVEDFNRPAPDLDAMVDASLKGLPDIADGKSKPSWTGPHTYIHSEIEEFKVNTRKALNKLSVNGLVSGNTIEAFDELLREM